MTFDGAGIIRPTHEDGREVPLIERLITLREVLMSWTIYVSAGRPFSTISRMVKHVHLLGCGRAGPGE